MKKVFSDTRVNITSLKTIIRTITSETCENDVPKIVETMNKIYQDINDQGGIMSILLCIC